MALARFHNLPAARRAELLEVAAEAFAEGGYDGTSFNRLIERLGLSKSQAYYYFADKADLFATACARCYEDYFAEVATLPLPDSEQGFWAYVLELNRLGFGFYSRHPMAARLARAQAGSAHRDELVRAGVAQASSTEKRYLEWVELGQRLGAVRDDLPRELIVALCVQVMACSDVWFSDRAATATAEDVEQFARAMTELAWRMWHRAGAERPGFGAPGAAAGKPPAGGTARPNAPAKGRKR